MGGTVDPALPGRNSTRFGKYLAWLRNAHGSLSERSDAKAPLFASVLPYPEALRPLGSAVSDPENSRGWAMNFVNTVVAWSNFVVLGFPHCDEFFEPPVAHRSVQSIRPYADKLLGEVVEFMNPEMLAGTLSCEGKRSDSEALIASGTDAWYGSDGKVDAKGISTALPVVADRVAIPVEAGLVDPCGVLGKERAEVVAHLPDLRMPEECWGAEVRACHNVPPEEEAPLIRKLLQAKMVVLLPEDELPRTKDGRLLLGGLFSVKKNENEDRLIYDRRPENNTMQKLNWARLPMVLVFAGSFYA